MCNLHLFRSIEYTIYDNEVKEARKKLDKLAEQREELNTRQSKVCFLVLCLCRNFFFITF